MTQRNYYKLTDPGIVCALGAGVHQVANALFKGSQDGIVKRSDLLLDGEIYVAAVNEECLANAPDIPEALSRYHSRNNQLLLAAYQQIADDLNVVIERFGADRVGVVLGTSTSGVSATEDALIELKATGNWPEDYLFSKQEFGNPAEFIAEYLKIEGPAYGVSAACSSSAKVFAAARRLLDTGICDAVLVGGVDSLCRLTINGFGALESLSKSYCAPFAASRDGINIGEGAALFVMTKEQTPEDDAVYVLGVGESSDAHHISAPHPEGVGAIQAMQSALSQAKVTPDQVAYINLHGTGTPQNDAMESKAVADVLGLDIPASSTKSLTGHTLGAAGAIEAAFCWLVLSDLNAQLQLPPQITSADRDDTLAPINLVGLSDKSQQITPGVIMSNSFAFGGSNAALVLARGNYMRQQNL